MSFHNDNDNILTDDPLFRLTTGRYDLVRGFRYTGNHDQMVVLCLQRNGPQVHVIKTVFCHLSLVRFCFNRILK